MKIIVENIPAELIPRRQWVNWRREKRGEKWTKTPKQTDGRNARSNDSKTWNTFEAVLGALQNGQDFSGIGYMLHVEDGITFYDLDHCRNFETGVIDPWAMKIMQKVNSYTEVSPSGDGIRIITRARKPGPGTVKTEPHQIEVYTYGQNKYLTITGQHVEGFPKTIENRQAETEEIYWEIWPRQGEKKPHIVIEDETEETGDEKKPRTAADIPDDELLDKARKAGNGEKFRKLFDAGDTSEYGGDDSRADAALALMFAFWTGKDEGRMDTLFRRSALMRDKWTSKRGESTYGAITIQNAMAKCGDVFTPGAEKAEEQSVSWDFHGLKIRLLRQRRTPTKIFAEITVDTPEENALPFTLSTAETSLNAIASELIGLLAPDRAAQADRGEAKRLLRSILATATREEAKPKKGMPMLEVVLDKAATVFRLAHREKGAAWSEALNSLIWPRDFQAGLVSKQLLESLRTATDFDPTWNTADAVGAAEKLSRVAWATIYGSLPEKKDSPLGSDSKAAENLRDAVVEAWTTPMLVNRTGTVTEKINLAWTAWVLLGSKPREPGDEDRGLSYPTAWGQISPPWAAWAMLDKEGKLQLGMRYELFKQVGMTLPAIRSHDTFSACMRKLGLGADDRAGKGRTRAIVLSADVVAEVSAGFSGEE